MLLVTGLLLFFLPHLIPSSPALRRTLVSRFGENGYKGIFSLVALTGFALLVWGKAGAPQVFVWVPPQWGRMLALVLMPFAFIGLAAMRLPTNITRFTRHPMLWGVTLWALAHLAANGDLASILLFGCFAGFSFFAMWSANRRGAVKSRVKQPFSRDLVVLLLGIVLYLAVLIAHPYLFGVQVIA